MFVTFVKAAKQLLKENISKKNSALPMRQIRFMCQRLKYVSCRLRHYLLRQFCQVLYKGQYLDLCCSISLSMICRVSMNHPQCGCLLMTVNSLEKRALTRSVTTCSAIWRQVGRSQGGKIVAVFPQVSTLAYQQQEL